jgi:hypothetical protein
MKYKISIICFLILISCNNNEKVNSIFGKWYGISDLGYTELKIKYEEILIYSHLMQESSPISYSINGDSMYYFNYGYSVGFTLLNDTSLVLGTYDQIDTVYKLEESVVTFDEIIPDDTTAYNEFITAFGQRAHNCYQIYGKLNVLEIDTATYNILEEELIPINK